MTNVGISFGAVPAGWVVQVGTLTAYQLMVIGNAIAFVVSAVILVLLPPLTPVPTTGGPRRIALRDRPYLLLTALDGIMAVQFKVLTVAIPLWIVDATTAPHWIVSATMLTGTVIVVAFQVRVGRDVDSPATGAHAYRRADVAFLIARGRPGWYAVGAVFVLTDLAAPPAVRWAQHHRHAPRARLVPAERASTA
ncbi:MFS transporter [Streptomyces triticiradicis]|uniref:hypothetical protein n=1 Tax=Streptomyces triticiradicis TaxID=2651189 RepID=UPI001CEC5970|nr:hypothetical protein [Streptomyces triticiradicis]